MFFLFLATALFGFTIPAAAYLNYRLGKRGWQKKDRWRLPREGGEVAAFGVLCVYLQKIRLFNWAILAILVAVFVLAEVFFLTRNAE